MTRIPAPKVAYVFTISRLKVFINYLIESEKTKLPTETLIFLVFWFVVLKSWRIREGTFNKFVHNAKKTFKPSTPA